MKEIFADYNATFPSSAGHIEDVLARVQSKLGNPSSIHWLGRRSKALLESCRGSVAGLLGAPQRSVFFNSGATEGNNFVVSGISVSNVPPSHTPKLFAETLRKNGLKF